MYKFKKGYVKWESLISFFNKYGEEGFATAMISATKTVLEMNIEPESRKKHVIYTNK